VVAQDALERGADAQEGSPRAFVSGMGLELDPFGAERLEGVPQLEVLGLPVRATALEGRPDPGPTDLEPSVLGGDRHEPGTADGPVARRVDGRERHLGPGRGVGQRRIEPGAKSIFVHRLRGDPAPDRVVERNAGEVVEMTPLERFEPHARPLERDGRDPGLGDGRHRADGNGHAIPFVVGP
jgi:hypothetical protein